MSTEQQLKKSSTKLYPFPLPYWQLPTPITKYPLKTTTQWNRTPPNSKQQHNETEPPIPKQTKAQQTRTQNEQTNDVQKQGWRIVTDEMVRSGVARRLAELQRSAWDSRPGPGTWQPAPTLRRMPIAPPENWCCRWLQHSNMMYVKHCTCRPKFYI